MLDFLIGEHTLNSWINKLSVVMMCYHCLDLLLFCLGFFAVTKIIVTRKIDLHFSFLTIFFSSFSIKVLLAL